MLARDVDDRGGRRWVGEAGAFWEIPVLSVPFYCEPKATLKIKFRLLENVKMILTVGAL